MTAILRDGVSGSGGSSSAAGTIPATIVAGDLMVLVVTFKAATGGASITTPAGWTPLAAAVNMTGGTGQARAYTRRSDGTEASTTLTVVGVGATQQIDWVLAAYSGAGGVRAFGFTDQGVTAATAISCAAQPAGPDDLVLAIASTRGSVNGGYTFTAPAGYNVDQQVTSTATAQDAGAVICSGTPTGAQTITATIAVWAISGQLILAGSAPATASRPRVRIPAIRRTRAAGIPVPGPDLVTPDPRPRRTWPRIRRATATATPPAAAVVPTPPAYIPAGGRARLRWPIRRRGTATPTPPAPAAVVAPTYVPGRGRPTVRRLLPLLRRRLPGVPVGQAPTPVQPPAGRRRRLPLLPARRRGAQITPVQVNPPHPPTPTPGRRGLWRLIDWTRRRHHPTGVPAPATITPPPVDDMPFDTDPLSLGWQFGAPVTAFDTDDLHNP